MLDVKIVDGTVVDGSGNPWFQSDIGIRGDRIVAIGDLVGEPAERVLDAKDKIIAPGFIDQHSHSDYLILANPEAESKVTVGTTTDISGNCGGSAAPQGDMFWQEWWTEDIDERFKAVTRVHATETLARHGIEFDWHTLDEYLAKVEKMGTSINYANYVGHYTLRMAAYGETRRRPTAPELDHMKAMVADSMKAGALGFTTEVGTHFIWEYDLEEVIELAKVAKHYGGIMGYELLSYGDGLLGALEEALWVAEQVDIPLVVHHLQVYGRENAGKAPYALQMLEEARRRGMNVVTDVMASNVGGGLFFSTKASDMLPTWATENLTETLSSESSRERLRNELMAGKSSRFYMTENRTQEEIDAGVVYSKGPLADPNWHHYVTVVRAQNGSLEGKTIAQIARKQGGRDRFETLFDLLRDDPDLRTFMVSVHEDNMREVVKHPLVAFGTDGGLVGAIRRPRVPNPTLYATFPMVIRKYVREERVLRLEECIRKMTSLPANTLGFYDRGLLRPGFAADIVVFDYDTIGEIIEYGDEIPTRFATGVDFVLVNGGFVVEGGEHTGLRSGKVLRRTNKYS